jgi:hypothetical protein
MLEAYSMEHTALHLILQEEIQYRYT